MGKLKIAIPAAMLLVIVVYGLLWLTKWGGWPTKPSAGPSQKISVGSDYSGYNALLWIAKDRGFAAEQGLELDIKTYETGLAAITVLKTGHVDLACCTEFVLVGEILQGNFDLRILGALSSGDNNELIVRPDRGISRPQDLRGKIIAVPKRTSAEFSLGRYLALNNISPEEVTVIDVKPWDLAKTLASGKADAVLIWEPIIYDVMNKVGSSAVNWPAQQGQNLYWVLVGRENFIRQNPAALEKLLQALKQAADFIKQKPEEARAIMAARLNIPLSRLQTGKFPKRYELFLDQALILAMEDEAWWMIENKLTRQTQIPNFLNYFYVEPLAKIAPRAIQLIIPKNEPPAAPGTPGTVQAPR